MNSDRLVKVFDMTVKIGVVIGVIITMVAALGSTFKDKQEELAIESAARIRRMIQGVRTDKSSFVFRVCFTTDREDTDVILREVDRRDDADLCAWVVTCESAEVKVRLDPDAKRSFWRANGPKRCE